MKLQAIAEAFNVYVDKTNTYDLRENSRTFMQVSNITGIRSGSWGSGSRSRRVRWTNTSSHGVRKNPRSRPKK